MYIVKACYKLREKKQKQNRKKVTHCNFSLKSFDYLVFQNTVITVSFIHLNNFEIYKKICNYLIKIDDLRIKFRLDL